MPGVGARGLSVTHRWASAGSVDAIAFGGATGAHRRRRPLPPTRDRADGSGTAGTGGNEPSLWGGR